MTTSRIPHLLGVQISTTVLALIMVCLRLYTRKYIREVFSAEDWAIALSMILAMASMIITCCGILGGTGLHYYDIPLKVDQSIAAAVLYQPILQTTKISILLFFKSCFGHSVRKQCIVLIAFSVVFCVACTIVEFLQCHPASLLWTGRRPAGYKCLNQKLFFEVTGLINLALDLVALGIPIPVIWNLQATTRTRIALSLVFAVGLLSIGAEIARLAIWFKTSDGNRQNPDASWNRVTIVNWSTIEYATGLICASLPHLKPLVKSFLPNFFESILCSLSERRSEDPHLKSRGPSSQTPPRVLGRIKLAVKPRYGNESEEYILDTLEPKRDLRKNGINTVRDNENISYINSI